MRSPGGKTREEDKPVTLSSLLKFTSRLISVLLWRVKGKKILLAVEEYLQMFCFGWPYGEP